MLWSLWISLVLIPAHLVHSHSGSPGLFCTNDYVNNVSCSWSRPWRSSAEDCCMSGVKKFWTIKQSTYIIRSCKLKQRGNSSLGCSFVFENTEFSYSEVMPNISLKCNNTLVESIKSYRPVYHIKMHPPEAPQVNLTSNFTLISGNLGSPVSIYFKSGFNFHLQIKQREQQWEDSKNINIQQQELSFGVEKLKGHLEVRVRVKPVKRENSTWSNWSPTTSYLDGHSSKTSDQNPLRWILIGLGLCLVVVVMLVIYKCSKTRGLLKGQPLPNPSEYFQSLHTVHQGNLKEWLNPISGTESFFVAPSCDQISHVVVCEDWNERMASSSPTSSSTSPLLHLHRYPTSCSDNCGVIYDSSSKSSFSNKDYFMSSSSGGSARTNPSPAYFTYNDNFQNLPHIHFSLQDPLTLYPEYESLKREPESPDSGFGIMREDEMKETQRVVCREVEKALNNQTSPLFLPLHLPSRPPSSPSVHPSALTASAESQQMDAAEADPSSSPSAQLGASAMSRSSSMPVEPFKSGYLTLKELQMTFSNKSI